MAFQIKDLMVPLHPMALCGVVTDGNCPTASALALCGVVTDGNCPTASAPDLAAPGAERNLQLLRRQLGEALGGRAARN